MIQLSPVYVLLIVFLVFLIKIIDTGKIVIKQRVSYSPAMNAIYYAFGVFSVLSIITMLNQKGLIHHRLMIVILLGITAFIFIPSVFVKPTKNSLISTIITTALAIVSVIIILILMPRPQDVLLFGFLAYLAVFFAGGAGINKLIKKINKTGNEELFYKKKLWEILNKQWLLIPIFALIAIELWFQFNGYSILPI